jgi:hypothetical protein
MNENWSKRNKILLYIMTGVIIFLCVAVLGSTFYIKRIFHARKIAALKLQKITEESGGQTGSIASWLSLLEENDRQIRTSEQRLKQEFESLIEMQISTTQKRISKELDEKIDSLKKILAANMLDNIEKRLTTTQMDKSEGGKFFTAMIDKLGEINKTHSQHLVSLEDKLDNIQKMKMVAQPIKREREISQAEVDSIIKQEVRKQLSSLNGRRDSRVRRLKKVVALEKMRRLVRGMLNGEDNDDILDF